MMSLNEAFACELLFNSKLWLPFLLMQIYQSYKGSAIQCDFISYFFPNIPPYLLIS